MATPPMQLPPTSDPSGWLNAGSSLVIAAMSVAGFIGGIILAIWRLVIKPLSMQIDDAHQRLDVLHQDLAAEKADRLKMHIDNMDMTGMVRREVVNARAELIEKIANKADKDDIDGLREDLGQRIDRLTERLPYRPPD